MSRTSNFNDFSSASQSLALGLDNFSQTASIDLEHQLKKDCALELKYSFMKYNEKSNGGIDDYTANLIYTGLKMKF